MKHMKKTITFILVVISFYNRTYGQSEHEKKYFKEEYTDTIKNESILIVRDYEEYQLSRHNTLDFKVKVVLRTQYKLKDIFAVESFNTLYKSKGLKKIIITQIKPDGKVKEIYIYEDEDYNEERSEYNVRLNEGDDKMAVEGLEIGDIIDYRYEYSYTTTTYPYSLKELENGRVYGKNAIVKNYNIFKKLPQFTRFLQSKYPTLSFAFTIKLPNELKLLQKAVNCNYKFTKSNDGGYQLYKCRVGYTKSYKSEYFSYSHVDLPVLKFCIVNVMNAKMQNLYPYQFLSDSVSEFAVAHLGRTFYSNPKFIPHYFYYLDTRKYSKGYEDASLNSFFGAFLKTFAKDNTDKLDVLNKFHEYITNNDDINEWQFGKMNFAVLLARFCDKIKQPYKMLACLHIYDGSWNKVIHPSEISWGIFIENGEDDLFITSSESASNIYEKDASFSGTEVLLFNLNGLTVSEKVVYPEIGYSRNKLVIESDVRLQEGSANYGYQFKNFYTYTGSQKKNINDNIAYKFYPEGLETNSDIEGIVNYRLYNEEIFRDTGTFLPEFRRIGASYGKKQDDISRENFENYLYSEYHFKEIEMDSFKIIEGVNYPDNADSENKFRIEFKTENVIEKAGNDFLILNLGRLITEQMEISNFKNKERLTNINITNQKEIDWDIAIELPNGYKPVNLADFNQKFENSAGIFNATVMEEGNIIKLKVEKIYKVNFLPKEKWEELTTFLKQAVLFYEKKLILEK